MPAPRKEISRPASMLRAASSPRWATSSGSERAGSRSSGRPSRTPGGICSKRSSIESTPIVSSICSRSCSVSDRKLTRPSPALLLVEELLVGVRLEQPVGLRRVREADPDEPAFAVGILVHGLGRFDDLLVDLDHLARERRNQVGDGLDRLDLAVGRILRDRRPRFGWLEMDEFAERVLREPGDPERRLVAVDPRPVVLGVVLQLVGIGLSWRHSGLPPACRSAFSPRVPAWASRARRWSARFPARRARRGRTPCPCRRRASAGGVPPSPPPPPPV